MGKTSPPKSQYDFFLLIFQKNTPLLNSIHFSHFFMYKSMKNNNNTYATRCVWTKVYKILILIIKCFFHFYCYVDEATHNATTGTIRPFWLNWNMNFSGKNMENWYKFSCIQNFPSGTLRVFVVVVERVYMIFGGKAFRPIHYSGIAGSFVRHETANKNDDNHQLYFLE